MPGFPAPADHSPRIFASGCFLILEATARHEDIRRSSYWTPGTLDIALRTEEQAGDRSATYVRRPSFDTEEHRLSHAPLVSDLTIGPRDGAALRFHHVVTDRPSDLGSLDISAIELLLLTPVLLKEAGEPGPAVIVVHLRENDMITRERIAALGDLTGDLHRHALLHRAQEHLDASQSGVRLTGSENESDTARSTVYHVLYSQRTGASRDLENVLYARELASLQITEQHGKETPEERAERVAEDLIALTSMDRMVLRHGTAIIATPNEDGAIYAAGRLYLSTMYLDVLALALLQRCMLEQLLAETRALAASSRPSSTERSTHVSELIDLRHRLLTYSATYAVVPDELKPTERTLMTHLMLQLSLQAMFDEANRLTGDLTTIVDLAQERARGERDRSFAALATIIATIFLPVAMLPDILQMTAWSPGMRLRLTLAGILVAIIPTFVHLTKWLWAHLPATHSTRRKG